MKNVDNSKHSNNKNTGGKKMNTLAITIPRNNHFKVLEAINHQSKSNNKETNNSEVKKLSEYEKAFLEMTDEEMESLIATMNEE